MLRYWLVVNWMYQYMMLITQIISNHIIQHLENLACLMDYILMKEVMKLLCMSLLKIIISFMDSKGGKHE